jgi:hypothetical protein
MPILAFGNIKTSKKVEVTAASTRMEPVSATYKDETRQVVDQAGTNGTPAIPEAEEIRGINTGAGNHNFSLGVGHVAK